MDTKATDPIINLTPLLQARDEIRVKIHLAEADLRDEWEKAEVKWGRLQGEVERLRDEVKQPGHEIAHGAAALLKDLSEAYTRIGAALRRPV